LWKGLGFVVYSSEFKVKDVGFKVHSFMFRA